MFGWPHADVEQECAFLAEHGYMGVKVYPSQEQVMSSQPFDNTLNPWYFMYQPALLIRSNIIFMNIVM